MWPRRGKKRCRNEAPPAPQPAQVRERVFLGDADDAKDFERLQRLGITGVLSLCPEYMKDGDYAGIHEGLQALGIEHAVETAKDSGRQARVHLGLFAVSD